MERIERNFFLNVDDCLRNHRRKILSSGDQLDHFERYLGLEFVFSS